MEFIKTILTEGLNEINQAIKIQSKNLFRAEDFCIVKDDLVDLFESPTEYIEDMVGYSAELKDEPIKDLSPLQRALAELYFERGDTRKYLDRDLTNRVLNSKDYKDLVSLLTNTNK